jgi:hypothetical protein
MMKTTGYKLQAAIREAQEARTLNESRWANGQMAWPADVEKTTDPSKFIEEILLSEQKIARLQTAQAQYNLTVKVKVHCKEMLLHEAVKLVGGAGRVEALWKTAAKGDADTYRYGASVRDKDSIVAVRLISQETAMWEAAKAAKFARALREAIQAGNANLVDIAGLDDLGID